MSEQQDSDDGIEDGIERSDLRWIQSATASANNDLGSALGQSVSFVNTGRPAYDIGRVHSDLIDAYGALCRAIDAAEQTIDNSDYDTETPLKIKNEHAERIKETYDHPVVDLALMLLEANRRKWLHQKPETNGADEVRRHGLTSTQRDRLNRFQKWSKAAEEIEDTIPTLRGEAEEIRDREDFDEHLRTVAEQLEHRADRLEAKIGGDD